MLARTRSGQHAGVSDSFGPGQCRQGQAEPETDPTEVHRTLLASARAKEMRGHRGVADDRCLTGHVRVIGHVRRRPAYLVTAAGVVPYEAAIPRRASGRPN